MSRTEQFPACLRRLRIQRRYSQRGLSELCGLSKNSVNDYERGKRSPSIEAAAQLADVLGVTMDYLCKGDGGQEAV